MREEKSMGERIRKRRKHLCLGLVDIARPLGLTPYEVCLIEKGMLTLEGEQLIKLAKALNTNVNYLSNED